MVDINLRVNGNSSSGVAAMEEMSEAIGKSAEKWRWFSEHAEEAVKEVVKFAAEAVKMSAEHERLQRQLARASGEYSAALEEQAKALSKLYAVDDDVIMKGQILLTQWGGAGAASEEVTKATLNLAAAMGTDLNGATEMLIRNVESGGVGLGKLGVHFKATGEKGHDLEAAVEAINKKFGGAAGANADSLTGRMAAASIAFEEVKKSIGHEITTFLDWSGAVETTTKALQELSEFITQDEAKRTDAGKLHAADVANARKELKNAQQAMSEAVTSGDYKKGNPILVAFLEDVDRAQAKLNALLADEKKLVLPSVDGPTNKGLKEAAKGKTQAELDDISLENAKKLQRGMEDIESAAADKEEANYTEELSMSAKRVAAAVKEGDDKTAALQLSIAKDNELYDKQVKYRDEQAAKMLKETNEANARALEEQTKKWGAMGDSIGAAFVTALGTQLDQLAAGGEFDVTAFIGDVLAATAGIAATAIGTYLGAPAIGAAVGNIAAMGIHAGFTALKAGSKPKTKTYHAGGWVDDEPRYHSGSWIGTDEQRAILQTGERVASRQEVANAGGKSALDATLKGRGAAVNVTIHAIDSKSAADSFASDLGRGMRQAIRSGRGDLPSLLGVGVR